MALRQTWTNGARALLRPDGSRDVASAGRRLRGIAALSALVAVALAANSAEKPAGRSLGGEWGVLILQEARGCEWNGVIRLAERDGRLSGNGWASAPAPRRCPRLEGKVSGEVNGEVVRFGFGAGALGRAQFEGRIEPGSNSMYGTWTTRSAAGEWAAAR